MHSIQKFDPECAQLIKRPWTQSNAHQGVKFCGPADASVEGGREISEKVIDQVYLNTIQKVVAVQRAEAGGAQKVSILNCHGDLF